MTWQTELQALGKLEENVPLASRTTLGVGGNAAWLFRPFDQDGLIHAMKSVDKETLLFPIGRGSNLLITDQGIDGLVIDLSDLGMLKVDGVLVEAGAGVRLSKLAQLGVTHGLTGFEFMATVPGDLGGGVAMNAGAFGQQVSDVLLSIQLLTRDGEVKTLSRQTLDMSYRHTRLPKGTLILSAKFELQRENAAEVRQRMREMRKKRSDSQPLSMPNCGSVFKNPEGDYAARLIESVGLKGKQIGKANISTVHANFIVNQGDASCEDVLALMRLAKNAVKQETNIDLEPEVSLVGCSL